jgi:dTDP-4-dehydrorhamnose 3,5-epimerase
MQAQALAIPGCYLLQLPHFPDDRGDFRKLFHAPAFRALQLETEFEEAYVTRSHAGVLRGMHCQLPPSDHAKLVICITGRARDGLVDLRVGSPVYGQGIGFLLDADSAQAVYVPRGVAHGFASYADDTRMLYLTTSAHDPALDAGVRADSVGIDWWTGAADTPAGRSSARDQALPPLERFVSPFVYGAGS